MSKKLTIQTDNLFNSILYIGIGLLIAIFGMKLLDIAMTVVGVVLIVIGVLKVLKKNYIEGAIMAAIGILVIVGAWFFIEVIMIVFGVALIIKGVMDLIKSIQTKNTWALVSAIITAVVGILLAVNGAGVLNWLFIIIGAILIIDGVLLLLGLKK